VLYKKLTGEEQAELFPLFLKDGAIDWYDGLSSDIRKDHAQLLDEFEKYFMPTELERIMQTDSVLNRKQMVGA
jgi:hypothetical protein